MIKSMTGYGSASGSVAGLSVVVELKSVNNRYLDTSVRMPRSFIFAEDAVKTAVQSHISRGKVDVFVTVDSSDADDMTVKVNEPLLKGYLEALNHISAEYGLPNDATASSAARFPDVLTAEKNDMDADAVSAGLCQVAEQALDDFDAMRAREGEKLEKDVLDKLSEIERLVSIIEAEAPKTVEDYRQRLMQKMEEVLDTAGIDENRIIQEAAIYADHIAVDEETVRLRSHISQLKGMLKSGSPIGRKIDFLVQEFNREANTIGSKCQNSDIAHVVVDLKSEIEKIREQIQNIE
jgi:uncharacterized protein (TIGR00255 family)